VLVGADTPSDGNQPVPVALRELCPGMRSRSSELYNSHRSLGPFIWPTCQTVLSASLPEHPIPTATPMFSCTESQLGYPQCGSSPTKAEQMLRRLWAAFSELNMWFPLLYCRLPPYCKYHLE